MADLPFYTLGLDPGKARDPTALALIESDYDDDIDRLRELHRFPLGTPLTELPALLTPRLTTPPLAGRVRIAIDATGIGGAIVELLRQRLPRIDVHAITITSGASVTGTRKDPRVPKQDLIATTSVILEQGFLRIAKDMRETETLRDELLSFQQNSTEHGHDTFGATSGQHDDLVIALSLALWLAEKQPLRDPNLPTISWARGDIPGIVQWATDSSPKRTGPTCHPPLRAQHPQKPRTIHAPTRTPTPTKKGPHMRAFEMGGTGLEPVTPSLSSWCSPN